VPAPYRRNSRRFSRFFDTASKLLFGRWAKSPSHQADREYATGKHAGKAPLP
jgi:hypothetical protein